jgi:hypothetical protein
MGLRGLHADIQHHRNFLAALTLREKLHDFPLPARQAIPDAAFLSPSGLPVAESIQHHFGNFCREEGAVRSQGLYRRHQVAGGIRFEDISANASLHNLINELIGKVKAEDDNFCVGQGLANLPGGFETVQLGHPDVHHDDVWLGLKRQGDRFPASLCLATYFPAAAFEQELPQPGSDDVMIIRNQNPHRLDPPRPLLPSII